MDFELIILLLRSICVGVVASITVGPVAVLCIQRTLSKDRKSGIISGLGVSCADTVMAIAAFTFYSVLYDQIQSHQDILRVIGGIFVVMVGVYLFAQNPVVQVRKNRAGKINIWQDFISAFGLTIANFIMVIPYLLAFFAIFNISSIEANDVSSILRSVIVIGGFFSGSIAWWLLLAFTLNLVRRRFRPRHMVTINYVAGSLIGVLGIYTILSTFFDIFPNGN